MLALYPADIDMQAGIGFCQLRRGAYSEAVKTFRAAHNVAPRDARINDGLAAATEAAKQH